MRGGSYSPRPCRGEGWERGSQEQHQLLQHTVHIRQHVAVGKSDHPITLFFEINRPGPVICFLTCMRVAVDLYHQHWLSGREFGDIRTNDRSEEHTSELQSLMRI